MLGEEMGLEYPFLTSTGYFNSLAETFDKSCAWPADMGWTCSPVFSWCSSICVTQLVTHEVI